MHIKNQVREYRSAFSNNNSICAYFSRKYEKPEVREEFYNRLDSVVQSVSSRDILIIAGDMNAKTGSEYENYKLNMGQFGKGIANENGIELLNSCHKNELLLTNTTFKHNMSKRTTWTCPERVKEHLDRNKQIRRNPYRNQIDYLVVRTKHRKIVNDSRSYIDTNVVTDHKLVMMKINTLKISVPHTKKNKEKLINFENLREEKI